MNLALAAPLDVQDYEGATNAFTEALKLDPANGEINKALR
jgi:cytochrome c-type biogenesis protein CcmH/NrfG